jgi:Aspartyl protease
MTKLAARHCVCSGHTVLRTFIRFLSLAVFITGTTGLQSAVKFPFELREEFIWVTANVTESSEPLNFLLDTGAEVSTLNTETAKRLKLKGGKPVRVAGVSSKATGYWPQTVKGKVSDVELPSQFLVTDLCVLQDSCQCRVDGLLGADFLKKRVVQIDFIKKEICLLDSTPTNGGRIPIRFRKDLILVPVAVDENEQWMRLDTGCVSALEWVSPSAKKASGRTKVSIGLSPVRIPTTHTTVGLGKWQFKDVRTGLHATPLFASEDGLLGLGLLSRFGQVTIDTTAKTVVFAHPR